MKDRRPGAVVTAMHRDQLWMVAFLAFASNACGASLDSREAALEAVLSEDALMGGESNEAALPEGGTLLVAERDSTSSAFSERCADDQNGGPFSASCTQGAKWVAWEYVPLRDIEVRQIALHTQGGEVAVLSPNGQQPGQLMARATLRVVADGWSVAEFDDAPLLRSGTAYFVATHIVQCSAGSGNTAQRYYGGFHSLEGPWEGPYQHFFWAAKIRGACAPE